MKSSTIFGFLILTAPVFASSPPTDSAQACYGEPLPDLPQSKDNRTVPWSTPSIVNGTSTCCSSLDEVRAGIDAIDAQLLQLLSQRLVWTLQPWKKLTEFFFFWGSPPELDMFVRLHVLKRRVIRSMFRLEINKWLTTQLPVRLQSTYHKRLHELSSLRSSIQAFLSSFVW